MLVHGGVPIHGDDALRRRGSIAKGTVQSHRVVVPAPLLDDDAGFLEGVEALAIEQLVPEAGIEALAVTVLPR
jgi:hypothetical protein